MECNDLPNDVFEDNNKVKTKDNNKVISKDSNQVKRKPKFKTMERQRNDNDLEKVEEEEMDDIAVFLHEDVADSLFGGGDSVDEDMDVVEIDDTIDSVDEVDEPADLVPASDDDADSDPDPDDPDPDDPDPRVPLRKSVRFSRAPMLFSYDKVGGPPVLIDVKSKR